MDGIGTSSRRPFVLTSPQTDPSEGTFVFAHMYAVFSIPLSFNPTTVCVSVVILGRRSSCEGHRWPFCGYTGFLIAILVRRAMTASCMTRPVPDCANRSGSMELTAQPSSSCAQSVSLNRSAGSSPTNTFGSLPPSMVHDQPDSKKSCSQLCRLLTLRI
jgi:hypothetical protein